MRVSATVIQEMAAQKYTVPATHAQPYRHQPLVEARSKGSSGTRATQPSQPHATGKWHIHNIPPLTSASISSLSRTAGTVLSATGGTDGCGAFAIVAVSGSGVTTEACIESPSREGQLSPSSMRKTGNTSPARC